MEVVGGGYSLCDSSCSTGTCSCCMIVDNFLCACVCVWRRGAKKKQSTTVVKMQGLCGGELWKTFWLSPPCVGISSEWPQPFYHCNHRVRVDLSICMSIPAVWLMADLSDFLYHCLQPFVIDPETSLYNETRLDKRTCFSKHHVLLPPLQLKSSCFTSYSTFAWLESSSGLSRLCCSHWTTTNQPIRIELLLQVNQHHLVSIPIFFFFKFNWTSSSIGAAAAHPSIQTVAARVPLLGLVSAVAQLGWSSCEWFVPFGVRERGRGQKEWQLGRVYRQLLYHKSLWP